VLLLRNVAFICGILGCFNTFSITGRCVQAFVQGVHLYSNIHHHLLVQGVIQDRDHRITELEEALRESIRITAQREVVMHEQQMKLEHTERVVSFVRCNITNWLCEIFDRLTSLLVIQRVVLNNCCSQLGGMMK